MPLHTHPPKTYDILVVDDTPDSLRLLTSVLIEQGYQVRPVLSGKKALSSAQARPPDLVLLDIMMPDMDGFAVCKALKADDRTHDIPIMFISALYEPFDKVKGFALGAVDYITKPFHAEEVVARVRAHVSAYAMREHLQEQNIRLEREIAERQRVEQNLRKFSRAIEQSASTIVITDQHGKIEFVNPAFTQITGYTLDEALGKTPGVLKSGKHSPEFYQALWRTIRSGEVWQGEFINKKKDDTLYWERATISPVKDEHGSITHFVAVKDDITRQKQAEKALRQAKFEADSANRAKSEFLANMSHELRTPMNGILGYTQLMLHDAQLSPKQRRAVETIHRSGEHLLEMINDVLDLAKIEAGKIDLSSRDFLLSRALRTIIDMTRIRAKQKGLSFSYEPAANLPEVVYGDEKRLRQILINLLGNAVKFTEKGSVSLRVFELDEAHGVHDFAASDAFSASSTQERPDSKTHNLNHLKTHTTLRFEIEDTGIGIPPENLLDIFHPFQQVGSHLSGGEGTGLGLTISARIIQLMNSTICVESTPGQGSRFWFDLRLPVSNRPFTQDVPVAHHMTGYTGRRRKVLIADDNADNRAILTELLAPLGFEIAEARNGYEALSVAMEWHPDMIFMDIVMPVMDGLEATRRIRHQSEFQHTSIVMVSASVFEINRQEGLEAGGNEFLAKPLDSKYVFTLMERLLGLTWIYDDSVRETQPEPPAALNFPNDEALQKMLEYARDGFFQEIITMLDQLEQEDSRYAAFIQCIRNWIAKFDSDAICQFLQHRQGEIT